MHSDHDSMSICSISQTINFFRQQNLRSWACVPANISETHLPRTIKCKEQNCSTIAALLKSAILSGEIIPRISADKERFKFTRPFQQVLSALILSCGLASTIRCWSCHQREGHRSEAKKSIERKKFAKEKSPELDKCPPSNIPSIAPNMTGNVDKK